MFRLYDYRFNYYLNVSKNRELFQQWLLYKALFFNIFYLAKSIPPLRKILQSSKALLFSVPEPKFKRTVILLRKNQPNQRKIFGKKTFKHKKQTNKLSQRKNKGRSL